MVVPSTQLFLPLPESLGIIENVRAIATTCGPINCKHIKRYHSLDGREWPKIFDSNSKPIKGFKLLRNDEPNTSVFQGIYTIKDETFLEGDLYFVFDFLKDDYWYKNYRTNIIHFKEDKDDYYDLLEMLNK